MLSSWDGLAGAIKEGGPKIHIEITLCRYVVLNFWEERNISFDAWFFSPGGSKPNQHEHILFVKGTVTILFTLWVEESVYPFTVANLTLLLYCNQISKVGAIYLKLPK